MLHCSEEFTVSQDVPGRYIPLQTQSHFVKHIAHQFGIDLLSIIVLCHTLHSLPKMQYDPFAS